MKNLKLNELTKIIYNCNNASVTYIIKELGLLENSTFKLNFNYVGCGVYDVNLMFNSIKLSSRIVCASSDLQYLTYMEVLGGWQLKILR